MPDTLTVQGLQAFGLSKSFAERHIFAGLSLELTRGQPSILIGPNGAGKSTLLDVIAAEAAADTGEVHLDGKAISSWPKESVRFIQQSAGLLPDLTVRETVSLWGNLFSDTLATHGLVERFGLDHTGKTLVKKMSGGEQQRLRLALSTIGHAEIYIYDEPTNNLDADARSLVCELIVGNAIKGAVVVVATHDIELLAEISGPVLMLQDGTISQVRAANAPTSSMIVGDRNIIVDDFASLDQVFAYGRRGA